MSASTVSVATDKRPGLQFNYPIAAGVVTLIGTLAALDASNNLVLATDAANRRIAGLFAQEVDNSAGNAGDLSANVEVGCFLLANSGTHAVTDAHVGKACWVEDNVTVASDPGTNAVVAGIVAKVTTEGVWVHVGPHLARVPVAVTAQVALTSTNGTAGAAADLTALKAEAENIGDDVRAVFATQASILACLKAHGFAK